MEVVDDAILLVIPGAMEAGLGDVLFWGSLSFALFVAFVLSRADQPLADRRRRRTGPLHRAAPAAGPGGPPIRLVAPAPSPSSAVFGTAVLIADAIRG